MLIGRINAKLDAKGRVVIPATYRKDLAGNASLIARMDAQETHLVLYTVEQWKQRVASLEARLDEWDDDDELRRLHWSDEAIELDIDAQGRVLIPKAQKERMQIKGDELTFAGDGRNLTIWDKSKYDEYVASRGKFSINRKEG